MLLELAIGDAYGAGFEYVSSKIIQQHNDLSSYIKHPRHQIEPGCYTDDTQMSIAIAETIVAQKSWTPEVLSDAFVVAFKREPRFGYAGSFYDFLVNVRDGREFLDKIIPTSDKSGAAMRAAPIGIFSDIEQVIKFATIQAAITHNTLDGINAAVAAALMAHYFIYQLGAKKDLGTFLETHVSGQWAQPWQGKVKAQGWISVQAAITAVMRNECMSKLLQDCISFTGDVDTVAAIALGAASCSGEIEQDIPIHLIESLENGAYGCDYLLALDKSLMSIGKNTV